MYITKNILIGGTDMAILNYAFPNKLIVWDFGILDPIHVGMEMGATGDMQQFDRKHLDQFQSWFANYGTYLRMLLNIELMQFSIYTQGCNIDAFRVRYDPDNIDEIYVFTRKPEEAKQIVTDERIKIVAIQETTIDLIHEFNIMDTMLMHNDIITRSMGYRPLAYDLLHDTHPEDGINYTLELYTRTCKTVYKMFDQEVIDATSLLMLLNGINMFWINALYTLDGTKAVFVDPESLFKRKVDTVETFLDRVVNMLKESYRSKNVENPYLVYIKGKTKENIEYWLGKELTLAGDPIRSAGIELVLELV